MGYRNLCYLQNMFHIILIKKETLDNNSYIIQQYHQKLTYLGMLLFDITISLMNCLVSSIEY